MSSQQIVDANGALHASSTGRFSGHLQQEGDADAILAAPQDQIADAQRLLRTHAARERLSRLHMAVDGVELPTEPAPRGSMSFGAGDPYESIRRHIEAVPEAKQAVRDAVAHQRELEKAITDFPGLPESAKEAIRSEIRKAEWSVRDRRRDVKWAQHQQHMALWAARKEIDRLEGELDELDPVDPADVGWLVRQMDCTEVRARQALRACSGEIEDAGNWLQARAAAEMAAEPVEG